jgi:hypothetical protein
MSGLDVPADFHTWPRGAQAAYFANRMERAEMVAAAADRAGVELEDERLTAQIRLSNDEFAAILAALWRRTEP